MAFDGTEGGFITLAQGAELTREFRENFPEQIRARFFGKEMLEDILAQENCKGIRMYFAQNTSGHLELVICGADEDHNDILDLIGDMSMPCPNTCSARNSLNS